MIVVVVVLIFKTGWNEWSLLPDTEDPAGLHLSGHGQKVCFVQLHPPHDHHGVAVAEKGSESPHVELCLDVCQTWNDY